MKTKIKFKEDQTYPIKVVIRLENREDALRFLAASAFGANPGDNPAGFYPELREFVNKDNANNILNRMLPIDSWEEIFDKVLDEE